MEWRLADAKNRFSELVNLALSEGTQRVKCRDNVVIILAERDYDTAYWSEHYSSWLLARKGQFDRQ